MPLAGGTPVLTFEGRLGWVDYVVSTSRGVILGYIVRFWSGGSQFYCRTAVNPTHCRDHSGDLRGA